MTAEVVRVGYLIQLMFYVFKACPLSSKGFPPDFLHDALDIFLPVEPCVYLEDLIDKRYFTLNELNDRIVSFLFHFPDRTNRPQTIQFNF